MKKIKEDASNTYTCNEYREEMILLGLKQQLKNQDLSEEEKQKLLQEIQKLEKLIGL